MFINNRGKFSGSNFGCRKVNHTAQIRKFHLYLISYFSGAENYCIKILCGFVNYGFEEFFHPDWRTAAMCRR